MKICMLFPGYGSQFVGMGKELYDESRVMQEFFEEASVCLPINFVKLCFASSDAELGKIAHAYPALFLVSVSIAALVRQEGIVPDMVAGCLGGEYAAWYTAGALSFPDGLYLLNKFATFYQEFLATSSYSAVRIQNLPLKKLQPICAQYDVAVAVHEAPQDYIITGHQDAIELAVEALRALGATCKKSAIEIGLHSDHMQLVAGQMRMYLEKVDFKESVIPVVSSEQGKVVPSAKKQRDIVTNALSKPVRIDKIIAALQPYDLVLEIGPGTRLSSLVAAHYPEKKIMAIHKPADVKALKELLAVKAEQIQTE